MHSNLIGGSSAYRIINCPVSRELHSASEVKGETNEYAERGTALHYAMEQLLIQGTHPDISPDGFDLREEADVIQEAKQLWDQLADERNVQLFDVEQRVRFEGDLEGCFGTVDVIAENLILDWKFGQGVKVSAVENHQLMFYAAAALETPEAADLLYGDTLTLAIIQPPELKTWTTTRARLELFRNQLVYALDGDTMKAGPWCRWCAYKPECPAHEDAARTVLTLDPAEDAHLSELLTLAEQVEDWARSVFEHAHRRVEAGVRVPGWKVVLKQGRRKWEDEAKAMRALRRRGLRAADLYEERRMVSPAKADRALKQRGVDASFTRNLTTSNSTGHTLVRESDRRPPVVFNPMVGLEYEE